MQEFDHLSGEKLVCTLCDMKLGIEIFKNH